MHLVTCHVKNNSTDISGKISTTEEIINIKGFAK